MPKDQTQFEMSQKKKVNNQSFRPEDNQVRTPRLDIFELESSYFVRLSIPGVQKENLTVSMNKDGILDVNGIVKTVKIPGVQKVLTQEIYEGPFRRRIQFPIEVDKNFIEVNCDKGILEIEVKKLTP